MRTRLRTVAVAAAAGACATYLLDPDRGRARRARLRDQARATVKRDVRMVERRIRYDRGRLEGVIHRASDKGHAPPANDHVLVDKVRSEVLGRMPDVEHRVSVDASYRVVTLRGELEDAADATRLEAAVRAVPGVDDVVNLIHRPGEAAPNKADALKAGH
jgi:osmotically-inducible protein OsmY